MATVFDKILANIFDRDPSFRFSSDSQFSILINSVTLDLIWAHNPLSQNGLLFFALVQYFVYP